MKILKLLSNFLLISFFSIVLFETSFSNEPVDIWKIERKDKSQNTDSSNIESADDKSILSEKIKNKNETIIVNQELDSKKIKLFGLYEPTDNGLSIDMWSNSDGNEIKEILIKINEKKLSDISEEILDIVLLTNSYQPVKNISSKEFLDFKFNYLIKQKDFELIKKFLIKNPQIEYNDKLVKFYTDFHLANSQLEKSCEIFEIVSLVNDEYLSNFKIYCLINQNKNEEAQLLFDLKTELGEVEDFFLKKFNFLMGYDVNDQSFSDNNILNLHISHKTNENFNYEPTIDTPKFVWKYLSSSNLLKNTELINLENIEQIKMIEKATNDEIYEEQELVDLYKRFQFDINQLINVNDSYKLLPDYQGRALLYQRLLLATDNFLKLDLSSKLKKSFDKSNLSKAFDEELSKILKTINENEIPSNFTTFYYQNKEPQVEKELKIKLNNKIFHQSKLLNYFLNKTSLPTVEKEANDLLKKIKKNKKYSFSKKDIIMVESLKSDGVQILKKYDKLYEYKPNLPVEINSMIVNGESGLVLLKIADIIGEDELEDIDLESVSFIVGILNELNTINLRNEILLKVLPLKV